VRRPLESFKRTKNVFSGCTSKFISWNLRTPVLT
jgi:hypothetical protein